VGLPSRNILTDDTLWATGSILLIISLMISRSWLAGLVVSGIPYAMMHCFRQYAVGHADVAIGDSEGFPIETSLV